MAKDARRAARLTVTSSVEFRHFLRSDPVAASGCPSFGHGIALGLPGRLWQWP
jgi:hypothetical protein